MMAYLRRLWSRYRHEPTSEGEHAEIERRLNDQQERLAYLRALAEAQRRGDGS